MPKSPNQKLKLLYLMQFFQEQTDADHPVTVARLIAYLDSLGISAERKSIYDDLEALRLFGLDIVQIKSKTTGYYLASRDFELPELKLLVDSVQSSKFITQKKTLSLIRKIESLASVHEAQELQRQVFVRNRVKSMNESVYYNVDRLSSAIEADRSVRFRYYEYTVTKNRRFRRDGAFYRISPFALLWDNENYYLLGYDGAEGILKHFRVDKMTEIEPENAPRQGQALFAAVDMSAYNQKVFGMFSGEEKTVRMRWPDRLVSAVIDRFGKEAAIIPEPEGGHFTLTVRAAVSPQFYAWLFAFGPDVEILSPEDVRRDFAAMASAVAARYE